MVYQILFLIGSNKLACLYIISNLKNDHIYIGLTTKPIQKRFKQHIKDAASGSNRALAKAIRKHGADNFVIEKSVNCQNLEVLYELEKYFIKIYKFLGRELYNMTDGGEGVCGYVLTEENRKKLSASVKKLWENEEYRQKATKNKSEISIERWKIPNYRDKNKVLKLSEKQVLEIVDLINQGVSQKALAEQFEISLSHVSAIKNGREWAWLTGIEPINSNLNLKVTEDMKYKITELKNIGWSNRRIGRELGLTHGTIKNYV